MTAIHILGISGSPRKMGNSRFLLDILLESAKGYAPDIVKTKFIPYRARPSSHATAVI
jgi:multimeric flavodoxin WrbA